ncbi:MAG TPA: adenylate/guanylate cyclase domain-containing protein [Labilithrix sp.]
MSVYGRDADIDSLTRIANPRYSAASVSDIRDSLPPGVGEMPTTNRVWATFEDQATERQFQKENFALSTRRFVRFSVTVSLVAFLSYGIHDALVIPHVRDIAWMVRYGFFGPVALALIAFVVTNRKWERHQAAMLVFGLAVNAVVIAIGAHAGGAGFFLYTSYAVVFVTLGPFLARMSVKMQVVYTIATLVLYNAFDLWIAHATPEVRISLNLAILTLGTIGALAAHQLEFQARVAFTARRVIREQMATIDAERARSDSLLLNVLPSRIAERLKTEPGVIADRFANATVLFSDIVGFTELSSRLEPDELVRRLDTVFSRFDEIAGDLGLEKIKTIGDAYMVAGGLPLPRADHAVAVCEMALRMRDALEELGPAVGGKLEVRIGVHSGDVVAGVIGKKKFIYDVWGDTVNTASRMESHGVPGAIQVTEATYALVKGDFEFEPRGEISVKGKGAMRTYLLTKRIAPVSGRKATLPEAV